MRVGALMRAEAMDGSPGLWRYGGRFGFSSIVSRARAHRSDFKPESHPRVPAATRLRGRVSEFCSLAVDGPKLQRFGHQTRQLVTAWGAGVQRS